MSDNQNNDLGIPKKDFNGISNEYDNILEKQQRIKDKENNESKSNNNTENIAKEKSQSITFTFDKSYFTILKKHFKDKGMMSQSIGIRAVLIEYMKNNGLIE